MLVWKRRDRIAVVDERAQHARIGLLKQDLAVLVHVDAAGVLFRLLSGEGAGQIPRGRVAHREAAAGDSELSGDCRQGENCGGGGTAVAVAFDSPAASNDG